MSLKTRESIRFYDYSVDCLCWVVQWQEEPIPLSMKSFDLLLYLIDHRDRVVSKDELLEKAWPEQFIRREQSDPVIFLLRKEFSRHGADQKIIKTVPGGCYRFAAPVIEPEEPTEHMALAAIESVTRATVEKEEDDSVASTYPAVLPSPPDVLRCRKRLALIGVAIVISLALGGLVWMAALAGPHRRATGYWSARRILYQ